MQHILLNIQICKQVITEKSLKISSLSKRQTTVEVNAHNLFDRTILRVTEMIGQSVQWPLNAEQMCK